MVNLPIIYSSFPTYVCNFFTSWSVLLFINSPSKYCLFQWLISPGEILFSFPNSRTLSPLWTLCTISSFCSLEYFLFLILINFAPPCSFFLVILLYNKSYFSLNVSSWRGAVQTYYQDGNLRISGAGQEKSRYQGYSLGIPQEVQDRLSAGKWTYTGKSISRV